MPRWPNAHTQWVRLLVEGFRVLWLGSHQCGLLLCNTNTQESGKQSNRAMSMPITVKWCVPNHHWLVGCQRQKSHESKNGVQDSEKIDFDRG